MRFSARVEVRLRPGIADPEGATVERALPALGFSDVHGVTAGRAWRFEVEATDESAAAARAAVAGFVLADTKFELGWVDGRLALCDEVCTPDSSRLWPADQVVPGMTPPAFDKQPLRDWLAAQPWDRTPPPPALAPEVVRATSERYVAAYERVTGRSLGDWYGAGA